MMESDALRILLAANADRPIRDALAPRELLELVIDFVNVPTLTGFVRLLGRDRELHMTPNTEHIRRTFGDSMTSERMDDIANQAVAKEASPTVAQATADLQAIIDGSLSPQGLARLAKSASQPAHLPVFDVDKGALRLRYHYRSEGLGTVVDQGIVQLLLDPALAKDLRRCKFTECRKFFIAVRGTGGRPRTEFCGKDCMDRQHKAEGSGRARDSRARAKAKQQVLAAKGSRKAFKHR